jgi:plastocyanin
MGAAVAADVVVEVRAAGQPVAGAVVSLHSASARAALRPEPARMDQRDSQFEPRVLVVQAGSAVTFPNSDNIRHHVYSFSPAKRFELPLYSGQPARPVVFGTPGVVTLGCNIHDWMIGHIVVLDTPHTGRTDARGRLALDAPAGAYSLQVWHPHQRPNTPPPRQAVALGPATAAVRVDLDLQAPAASPRVPADPKLRALQEKLRSLKRDP